MFHDLGAAELRPRKLFEGDTDKRMQLMNALYDINGQLEQFGAVPGSQGLKREWRLRADSRSPTWTTQIVDVPVVSA